MKYIGLCMAVSLLAACGGGGGGIGIGGGNGGVTSPTSTSGYAAKGIIQGATVLVCRIKDRAIEADALCAKGTTGQDGSYLVSLSDGWTGPVMVKIMPNSTSKMLDETTGNYVDFNLTDGIRAVVATAGTPAYVTPFSEVAANAAVATGNLDANVVQQANAMVQSNFGVDLSVKPLVDLRGTTDPSALGKQIAMVQKLAQIVNASKTGGVFNCSTIACGIQAMRAMAPSTTSVKQSAGTTMSAVFSASVPIQFPVLKSNGRVALISMNPNDSGSMEAGLKSAELSDANTVAAAVKTSVDQENANTQSNLTALREKIADSNGNVGYTPPTTTQLASLQQAKVMANFLREAMNRFSNASHTGYLDKQQNRISTELQNLVQPSIERTIDRLGAMQFAVQLYNDASAPNASGLPAITNKLTGKTSYLRMNGSVNDAVNGGNYTICTAEKASNSNAITVVACRTAGGWGGSADAVASTPPPSVAAGGGVAVGVGVGVGVGGTSDPSDAFSYLPSSSTYNGISSNSQTNTELVGLLRVVGFKITPAQEAGAFNYGLIKQVWAVTRDTSMPNHLFSYSIPAQNTNVVGGPYNYDVSSRLNTLDPNCVSPTNPAAYVNTSWSDTTGSTCSAFLGTGTVTQTPTVGRVTGITVKGTMPPSDNSNRRQIGFENVEVNFSATEISTSAINANTKRSLVSNKLSGFIETYETPISANSVTIDTTKVAKIALEDGSYLNVNRTLTNFDGLISSNAQEGTFKISFTAPNTKGVGILTANDWVFDKNGMKDQPRTMIFDGTLSDISSGGYGDILKGKFTMNQPNYAAIDGSKPSAYGNDYGATLSFVGSVNARQSSDYIKASLGFSSIYSAPGRSADAVTIRLEIAGGFVLQGSAVGDPRPGVGGTMTLRNQDGIIVSSQEGRDTKIYASDTTTELGVYKDSSSGSAFYFIDGSVISLY